MRFFRSSAFAWGCFAKSQKSGNLSLISDLWFIWLPRFSDDWLYLQAVIGHKFVKFWLSLTYQCANIVQYAFTECIWQKTSVLDDNSQNWTLGREFQKVLKWQFSKYVSVPILYRDQSKVRRKCINPYDLSPLLSYLFCSICCDFH